MKTKVKIIIILKIILMILFPVISMAFTEIDNEIMKVTIVDQYNLKGFDIEGYITDESTNEKRLIKSTFDNGGYHTFLNVNGLSGEMDSELTGDIEDEQTWQEKLMSMLYTEVNGEGWQTINGINIKVSTKFVNNGNQLQIIYDLKNTTNSSATFSLATAADVQIDEDDYATIERLEDGSGIKLWTKDQLTGKPIQFVFYGKDVSGTTEIDNLWIGDWNLSEYLKNIFVDNSSVKKIENIDSSFAYSWVNRTINAGESKQFTVLMQVGEASTPNTGISIDNNTKFYYKDVKINGTIVDEDLKDTVTVHYTVDGIEYTLPAVSTTQVAQNFTLDLTPLNLTATHHTLKVWATDSTDTKSNIEERTLIITYLKEPTVTLSTTEWAKNVTFKITDTINEQKWVDKYQYRINNGNWTDCIKDTNIPISQTGNVKIDVRIKGTQDGDYSNIVTVNAKVLKEETPPANENKNNNQNNGIIDNTITNNKIPALGKNGIIMITILIIVLTSFFFYKKFIFYRDLK